MPGKSNLEVAREHAKAGRAVFPCRQDKKPCQGIYWRSVSTTDIRQINAWWERFPDAIPGLDVAKSGFLILDPDASKDGKPDGLTAWKSLLNGHDVDCPYANTPGGGRHLYFRQATDPPLGNREGRLPKGINVRGAGGYVIAPGATLSDGRTYELHGSLDEAPLIPEWIIVLILDGQPDKPHQAPIKPVAKVDDARLKAYVEASVGAELQRVRGASKGARNNTMNEAAFNLGTMAGAGWLTESSAREWLIAAALDSGLKRPEALATIRSGLTAGKQHPRQGLPDNEAVTSEIGAISARNLTRDKDSGDLIDDDTGEVVAEAPAPLFGPQIEWTHPGGLLGEITQWILDTTSRYPNRALALGAAISVIGTVCGRHLAGPSESATNLYIACIGKTTAGKDRPLKAAGQLLKACGLGAMQASGFKSDTAIENSLIDNPCMLSIIDEIGTQFLARLSSKRASSHESGMGAILRTIWSANFEDYQTTARAAKKTETIEAPSYSIFGASTEDEFYNSMSGSAIENGFINRFTIIAASPRKRRESAVSLKRGVPQSIVDALLELLPPAAGNLSGGTAALFQRLAPAHDVMPWGDGARQAFDDFEERVQILMEANSDLAPFMGRTAEMAIRLATIHAVSRAGRGARMIMSDLAWGTAISAQSTEIMIRDVKERMSENDWQAKWKLVKRLIKERGELTKRELGRCIQGRIPPQEVERIILDLEASEHIISYKIGEEGARGKGRPSLKITYLRD